MTKQVQKWADVAMFAAKPINADDGPQVQLLSCNNDPLGTIAAAAKMYKGEYVESLAEITDDERRYYLQDVRKNVLAAPLEFVNFHFIISGVTRGFTHQMVRQRTATYTQESTRFAVKETVPVGLPPSLASTVSWEDYIKSIAAKYFPNAVEGSMNWISAHSMAQEQATPEQLWRREWDECVETINFTYNNLINSGMPAEEARGLLPTNLLTRINYNTSLRGLLEHSGLRLCTQAQFEWRLVWAKIKEAIVEYGRSQWYECPPEPFDTTDFDGRRSSAWQFEELSKIFKPICYQKGSCQFLSDGDRYCSIRDRVQRNAKIGRHSSEWDIAYPDPRRTGSNTVDIEAIKDEEWLLDSKAARATP